MPAAATPAAASTAASAPALAPLPQLTFDDIAPSPPPVERLGGYTLGAALGRRAGWGVWLARGEGEEASRAVARVFSPEIVNRRTLERFASDAVQLRRIDHPGAARVLAAGIVGLAEGPAPYIVEELTAGRPLLAHTAELGLRGKLYVLASLAEALHAAHLKGVAHRDLSPHRITVEESGRLRVRGFGVAHITNDDIRAFSSAAGAGADRVAHLAPEQATGQLAAIDARADVYSLGALGYRVLTGRWPQELRGTAKDAAKAIASATPAPMDLGPDELARDAESIIFRALRKRPEARHQSASELASDLTRALAGEVHGSREPGARRHLRLAAKRRPALAGAAAALLAVTAIGAGMAGSLIAGLGEPGAPALRVVEPGPAPDDSRARAVLVASEVPARTARMSASRRVSRAVAEAQAGNTERAERMLRRLIERSALPEERSAAQRALAELYADTGRGADAEPVALEALTRTVETLGADSPSARACYRTLARVLAASSREGQADQWWSLLAGAPAPAL